ncbi:MAG: CoA-binding protein [Chloroflexota bacterium]|nr:CoA-binding protein [Chloroflexota bacterium]
MSLPPLSLDTVFYPKSVAIIGASADERPDGGGWVASLLHFGFRGPIYPINPRAREILGLKAYASLDDVPGPVDLAIFNVPRSLVTKLMGDCVAKKVKVAHIYTAGFRETAHKEWELAQAEFSRIARDGGVRLVGPNCMGIYCPDSGLTWARGFPKEPGTVAFVSQSGASASRLVPAAAARGVRFSKVVSYGNAVDLDCTDFLEYLARDGQTEIIAAYVEGVKEGRRFLEAVKACRNTKPVVLLKAGATQGGSRAAASHTAALAGSPAIWDAFYRQSGAIKVETLEEIIDVLVTFLFAPKLSGRGVGIVGRGGGLGVMATDLCEKAGLRVPAFTARTQERLQKLTPEAGTSVSNPVEPDTKVQAWSRFYEEGLRIVAEDPKVDLILAHLAVDVYGGRTAPVLTELEEASEILVNVSKILTKPLAVVFYPGSGQETIDAVVAAQARCVAAGLPVYPSIEAAARAASRFLDYKEAIR